MTSYTAEFDDIPGTRVFTASRAKKGYELNQFCMSLMKEANRERFKANERAYLDEKTKMSEEQKQAVLDRDYNKMIDLGGQIYFLAKIFANPHLPEIDDYYEPFTYDCEHLQQAPELPTAPVAGAAGGAGQ